MRKVAVIPAVLLTVLCTLNGQIQEIISYKKATGIPILQPEQEKKQTDALAAKLGDNEFEEEFFCYSLSELSLCGRQNEG